VLRAELLVGALSVCRRDGLGGRDPRKWVPRVYNTHVEHIHGFFSATSIVALQFS